MGTTYKQLYRKLIGLIDVVPPSFAKEAVNEALRDIYDENDWGFLWKDSYIHVPAVISGTGSVAKFGNTLTLSVTTKALVDAIDPNDVPIDERQIRFLGTKIIDKAFIFTIKSYDTVTGIITFGDDEVFLDTTNAAIKFEILKIFYKAPYVTIDGNVITDFRRFEHIFSPYYRYQLNLNTTIEELNRYDAERNVSGEPRHFVPYTQKDGYQYYEMYPSPRTEKVYRVKYLRNGIPLVKDSDTIPDVISSDLVLVRAKQKAYEYVLANADKLKVRPSTYHNLIAMLNNPNNKSSYPVLLEQAKKRDEELFPKAFIGDFAEIYPVDYLGYDPSLPHDRFGDTLVIDANA